MCDLSSQLRDSPMLDWEFKKTKQTTLLKKAMLRRNCPFVTLCSRPYKADYMMWPTVLLLLTYALCWLWNIFSSSFFLSFHFLFKKIGKSAACHQQTIYLHFIELASNHRYSSRRHFYTAVCLVLVSESAVCLRMIGTYNGSWRSRWWHTYSLLGGSMALL